MQGGVTGLAIAAIAVALVGCGKKQEPAPATTRSAASVALEPLIQQGAELERKDEDDESVGLRDVSLEGFKKEIDTRRQLLEKIRQVDASGLSRDEDIDRRLMIGLLESETPRFEIVAPDVQGGALLDDHLSRSCGAALNWKRWRRASSCTRMSTH